MKKDEATYLYNMIDGVKYDPDVFTVWCGDGDKIVFGVLSHDSSDTQNLFNYATIYRTILDVDQKIKFSLREAIKWADNEDFDHWNPINLPSNNESKSIYFTENAVFRIALLWDMLAQLYNIKAQIGMSFERVYATQIFHNAQQGRRADPFAERVYCYMTQSDNADIEPWGGNYNYVKDFRDKMTHRNSPSISTMSDLAVELRMPMLYVLKRVVEDYSQVSAFIGELISEILKDYTSSNECAPPINDEER